jgi:dTDP-4-dehydrorhamnose reductase
MKVLITGANGMVARAMIAHSQQKGDEIFSYARQELDIGDREKVFDRFEKDRPDTVINCAAYTDVDGAETNEDICRRVNVTGVENLALAAKEIDCRFITISTDYVFDGVKEGFYTQRDTPNPGAVYAGTKYEGENIARKSYARSIIVRTGWIYGAGGTNFLSVMDRLLAEGKNIKVISDSYGTPTFAGDLVMRLRELAELDLPGIFHITNSGEGCSYFEFAEKVCQIKGFQTDLLEVISKDELKRPAKRPVNSRLKCLFSKRFGLKPMPGWQEALERFVGQ